ncbi:hypothetical protein [Isoptericola sp. NPDC057391]|uniref:hypothetical protein n=1 Tax=Isoptericola sp. NPDC057391 TaxID=3346117 RepID=UPI00363B4FDF
MLRELGWHVPQPEIPANEMNPRGFGEPEWAVRFNSMTLEWANVHISDARPRAWELIDGRETSAERRRALTAWLVRSIGAGRDVVIKDPRLTWLYRDWRDAAIEAGAEPSAVIVSRTPGETLASKLTVNPARGVTGGLAGWINVCLRAERVTRGERRAFVTYGCVLADWESTVTTMASSLGSHDGLVVTAGARGRIDSFIDPSLHRSHADLDGLDLPDSIRELADELWGLLQAAARSGSSLDADGAFDALRERYEALYKTSEALVESSFGAVERRIQRQVRRLQDELASARGDVQVEG